MNITLIIGTDTIGSDEFKGVAYKTEVRESLTAAFPEAVIDVVTEVGKSQVRVGGLLDIDEEEDVVTRTKQIANDVWNHGDWHNL